MHKETSEKGRASLIDYVSPVTTLKRCEYALLFGSRHAQQPLVQRAAELFSNGYYERIVVTGGLTYERARSEADELAEQLEAAGVAGDRIILETASSNTKKNIAFSRSLLQDRAIWALLLVGKIYAKRRYVMTVKRQWPEIERVFCDTINYFGVPREQWWQAAPLRERIISESHKIVVYLKSGDIEEVGVRDREFLL